MGNSKIFNPTLTTYNPYKGGAYQQAVSALTTTDQTAYELNGGKFSVYGFEYLPGTDNAVRFPFYILQRIHLTESCAVRNLGIEQPAVLDAIEQWHGSRYTGRDRRSADTPRTNGTYYLIQHLVFN